MYDMNGVEDPDDGCRRCGWIDDDAEENPWYGSCDDLRDIDAEAYPGATGEGDRVRDGEREPPPPPKNPPNRELDRCGTPSSVTSTRWLMCPNGVRSNPASVAGRIKDHSNLERLGIQTCVVCILIRETYRCGPASMSHPSTPFFPSSIVRFRSKITSSSHGRSEFQCKDLSVERRFVTETLHSPG